MLEMIRTERHGESVDPQLLKSMNEVLVKMGMDTMDAYTNDFEKPLLRMTREHYKAVSQEKIAAYSTSEYLVFAAKCLDDEVARVRSYMCVDRMSGRAFKHELACSGTLSAAYLLYPPCCCSKAPWDGERPAGRVP